MHRADRQGLARQRRLVHGGNSVDHRAVHRHQVAGPQQQEIAGPDLAHRNLLHRIAPDAPADLGRPREQRLERVRRAAHRVALERLPSRLHEHDDHAGEVLADQDCGDDGERGDDVRGEAAAQDATDGLDDEGRAAGNERREEDRFGPRHEAGREPDCRENRERISLQNL